MDEARVKAFRTLKPHCVNVGQVALSYKSKKTTSQDFVNSLNSLFRVLQSVSLDEQALDAKLADYVFFPLSHVFREAKVLPVQVVEIALRCLHLLILKGWKTQIQQDMSKQLLILLSFLAGGSPTESKVNSVNEELAAVAFQCISNLSQVSRNLGLGNGSTIKTENIPVLGHSVTVLLDGIADGPATSVRLAALSALDKLITCIADREALRNVFPGIISSLTKVLSTKGKIKNSAFTVRGLQVLENTLCRILSGSELGLTERNGSKNSSGTTDKWLAATAHQVKMALANIMPLKATDRMDVRQALSKLCVSLINSCSESLHQTVPMFIDTLVVLCADGNEDDGIRFAVDGLLASSPSLGEYLRVSLHEWITMLPGVMQSNDDRRKNNTTAQISTAYSLLKTTGTSMDMFDDSIGSSLQTNVATVLSRFSDSKIQTSSEPSADVVRALQISKTTNNSTTFDNIFLGDAGLSTLQSLLYQFQQAQPSETMQQGILTTLRSTSRKEILAALWLATQILSPTVEESSEMDRYVNFADDDGPSSHLLEEAYSVALSSISKSTYNSDDSTWPIQALSLEILALQARSQKRDFRAELVDALYPILERLGSSNSALQQHAMTCLNIVSQSCEYPNPAALIVDNADYLVNAISLKLNTFDISPQAPQVLVMMVNLCGPPLIPYLDDLVESIFSILASYHGYPKLVESLFTVLNAIVEEASKSSKPLIDANKDTTTRPKRQKPISIPELANLLRENRERRYKTLETLPESSPPTSPPSKPTTPPNGPSDPDDLSTLPPADPPAPKPSKSTNIITSITSLTPAHMSSSSPTLRASLLDLLSTSFPLLARDTDTFLPLAAQLYPYIATRLFSIDALPFETVAAAGAMNVLCRCAGDFLHTRIEDDFGKIEKVYARVERQMREEVRAQKGRLGGTWWNAWDALVGLVMSVVVNVGVNAEIGQEDAVFEMLAGYIGGVADKVSEEGEEWKKQEGKGKELNGGSYADESVMTRERKEGVKFCLDELNADLLWLVEEKGRLSRGGERLKKPDDVPGLHFVDLDI